MSAVLVRDGWCDAQIDVDGIAVAHWHKGSGTPLLLVHGVGPGTTGVANFGPLLKALTSRFSVHLTDLIGFGASGRKTEMPYFDVALWLRQLSSLLDQLDRPAIVFGNSVGGALALKLAALRPAAIARVLAVGAPAARFEQPAAGRAFWTAPQTPEELAAAMRPMTASQAEPAPELVAQRFAVLREPGNNAYFAGIVSGDGTVQLAQTELRAWEAEKIACPVTLVYGRQDRACPPELILPYLKEKLPAADIMLLGDCGHNVTYERGAELLALSCLQPEVDAA